jgi:hypothetical protein
MIPQVLNSTNTQMILLATQRDEWKKKTQLYCDEAEEITT